MIKIERLNLSNQNTKYIIEKAEYFISKKDFKQVNYFNQLINNTNPYPYYFKRCGFCYRMIGNADKDIDDYTKAIELDPDDGITYLELAPCYSYKISHGENLDKNKRKYLLKKALENYKYAIERIPTCPEAWLAIIEANLRLFGFDDAIGNYGACKPYINSKEYQTVRSWLGCLAFVLSGDTIEEEDEKLLNDL